MAHQIFKIRSILDKDKKACYGFNIISLLFDISEANTRSFYLKGEKYIKNGKLSTPGQPSKLKESETKELIEVIIMQENKNEPFSRQDLLDYIFVTYKVAFTDSWVDSFL
jgi:hypothetical protein